MKSHRKVLSRKVYKREMKYGFKSLLVLSSFLSLFLFPDGIEKFLPSKEQLARDANSLNFAAYARWLPRYEDRILKE